MDEKLKLKQETEMASYIIAKNASYLQTFLYVKDFLLISGIINIFIFLVIILLYTYPYSIYEFSIIRFSVIGAVMNFGTWISVCRRAAKMKEVRDLLDESMEE